MAPTEMCIGGGVLVTVPVSARTDSSAQVRASVARRHVTQVKYRIGRETGERIFGSIK
jgi:hypothetical protein